MLYECKLKKLSALNYKLKPRKEMYESEIYLQTSQDILPDAIYQEFLKTHQAIQKRSILHWSEHCTECAMPECFKTCDLYLPRIDGKCKRFLHGIEQVQRPVSMKEVQILKIQFKKWGVLATQGNHELFSLEAVKKREKADRLIAQLLHLPYPKFIKKHLSQKRYYNKKNRIILEQNQCIEEPHGFLIEIYNPSNKSIFIGLTIRNQEEKYQNIPFQYRIELKPGYHKETIPFQEISKRIQLSLPYRVDFTPENISSEVPLYFGLNEFVQFNVTETSDKKSKKIKCIVWDLDNTLWDGVLMEDGLEKLKLKEGIKEILKDAEQKGILHSIASKNNENQAMEALDELGIKDFFLYPKISWLPKSKGIREIAQDLNINPNTLLFVDDTEFERNEVQAVLPQVKIIDAVDYQTILDLDELQQAITSESKKRKQYYVNEAKRKMSSDHYEGEYFDFLRQCNIQLEISLLTEPAFARVYELTQRTNQMNFSRNRYREADIMDIFNNKHLVAYVLRCKDNFGDYGIIGFGIVNAKENKLIDLMFSCRIQSKRVEHAFLTYILEHYLNKGDFYVSYYRTEKNKFSAQVFADFNFETIHQEDSHHELRFRQGTIIPNDAILSVTFQQFPM